MAGIIPEGIWVLDEARSRKLTPGSLTLWIIRDDGDRLNWVGVEKNAAGEISTNVFDGSYDGTPSIVRGCEFRVSLTSPGPGRVRVEGEIPDMGPLEETSEISPDGRQMRVNGQVRTQEGVKTWYEEFNWMGPMPPRGVGA